MKRNNVKALNVIFVLLFISLFALMTLLVIDLVAFEHSDGILFDVVTIATLLSATLISIFAVLFRTAFIKEKNAYARRKSSHEQLVLSEIEYKIAAKLSSVTVFHYDIISKVMTARVDAFLSGGYPKNFTNVPESLISNGFIHEESVEDVNNFFADIERGVEEGEIRVRIKNLISGGYVWQIARFKVRNDEGPRYAVITVAYGEEKLDFHTTYNRLHDYVTTLDKEKIVFYEFNISQESFIRKEGKLESTFIASNDDTYSKSIESYIASNVYHEDVELCRTHLKRENIIASFHDGKTTQDFDYREMINQTDYYWYHLTITAIINDESDINVYLLFSNIDTEKREDISMRQLVEEDVLTHAYNRAVFTKMVDEALAETPGQSHALLIFDVDDFKAINDIYGHFAGDQVLVEVVRRVKSVCRKEDIIGRLGGDEFLVFLPNVQYDAYAAKKAQQICNALRMKLDDKEELNNYLSVSIGVSICPNDGDTFEKLYKCADTALYVSKRHGRDRFMMYDFSMQDQLGNDVSDIDKVDYLLTPTGTTCEVTKKYMLVVDDDKVCCDILDGIFQDDFIIYHAHDGEEAVKKIKQYASSLSVILLDIMMPVMDGYEVIKQINANSRLRSIPIVVITGLSDMSSNIKAISYGATDFVTKPFEPALVKLRVRSAIMKYENDRMKAQNDYLLLQSNEEERYSNILNCTGTIVFEYDFVNKVFIYDERTTEYLSGSYDRRPLWEIWLSDLVCDERDANRFKTMLESFANDVDNYTIKDKYLLRSKNNIIQWFSIELYKYNKENTTISKVLITLRNIDEEEKARENLVLLAERDHLTGIYNRTTFLKKANELIFTSSPYSYCLACMDIENFKVYNDLYGHVQGDEMLKFMAKNIVETLENTGLYARLSSDLFVILFPNDSVSQKKIIVIKNKMLAEYNSKFPLKLKCGIFTIDDSNISAENAYDCAAMAHKYAKRKYDAFQVVYDDEMRAKYARERKIIREMEKALEGKQFDVYFQPQYDYSIGAIDGAEALVRWNHPTEGVIYPTEFISLFENNGFISKLDNHVRRAVCSHIRQFLDEGIDVVPVSINISRVDIYDPNLVQSIIDLTKEFNISPEMLHFEITESAYLRDSKQIILTINELRKNGFAVEMDDFGSGYSSLNSLGDFHIDILKLDMNLINSENNANRKMIIAKDVIQMAHNIDLAVIAEGVEKTEQAESLYGMGCNRMQGFLFYHPMPASEFKELLKEIKDKK